MPPSPDIVSLDYTPDNAEYIALCVAQARRWAAIRKGLVARDIRGRGLHLATSRIGVWMSKAARAA